MSEKELIKQIRKLPSVAQQEAADFVEFLSKKYIQQSEESGSSKKKSNLESSFRGMWKDREDMQDSTKWVRKAFERIDHLVQHPKSGKRIEEFEEERNNVIAIVAGINF